MTQSWWLSKKAQPLLRNVAQAFCLMSQVTSSSRFFLIYCFRFELRKFIYSIRVVGTVKARPYINEDLMVLIDPVDFMDLIMDPITMTHWTHAPMSREFLDLYFQQECSRWWCWCMLNHFHTTTAATCAPHPSIQAATVIVSLPLKKRIPPFEIAILCTNHGSRNYLLITRPILPDGPSL